MMVTNGLRRLPIMALALRSTPISMARHHAAPLSMAAAASSGDGGKEDKKEGALSKVPPGATSLTNKIPVTHQLQEIRRGFDDMLKSLEEDFFGSPFGGISPFSPSISRLGRALPAAMMATSSMAAPALTLDIQETPTDYIVKAEIPGVTKENLHVEVDDARNAITVIAEQSGETDEECGEGESKWLLRERTYGKSQRTIYLPDDADLDTAQEAELNHGVLHFKVPKREDKVSKRKLTVK